MNESIYEILLKNINEIVILKDENGKIIYSNADNPNCISNCIVNVDVINYNNGFYKVKKREFIENGKKYYIYNYVNITNEKNLLEHFTFDKLTKLYNYEKIREELSKCVESCKQKKEEFIVVMADVDDFKLVNDTIGHINSNHILQSISEIFRNNIREDDKVGRFGGEEFLLIFKNTTLENVLEKTNKLRKMVMELNLYNIVVTISFGIAKYNGSKNIEEVLDNADKALYSAKKAGKNISKIYEN